MCRRLVVVATLIVTAAVLAACGVETTPSDSPSAPSSSDRRDARVEPSVDARADVDASVAPVDASAEELPDAAPPPCIEGDVTVQTAVAAASLAAITCIRGSLTVETANPIALPRLREVSGSVVLGSMSVEASFPALEAIGADFRVKASRNSTLSLPVLRGVTGTLFIDDFVSINAIDAPRLEAVGSLQISRSATVEKLLLPALTKIAGDALFAPKGLEALSLPNLERVEGRFAIVGGENLASVDLPRLREVIGAVGIADLEDRVISLSFPELEHAGSIRVDVTSRLEALSLPDLTHVGAVTIRATRLKTLWLPALVECGELKIDDDALTMLDLPELKKATGTIKVSGVAARSSVLTWVTLPKLEEAESLLLYDLPELSWIRLPALTRVTNELHVARAPHVAALSLPSLTSIGMLSADELATIESVSAPALLGSEATWISLTMAPRLRRIDLAALRALKVIQIHGLDRLTTFSLPSVVSAGQISLHGLPELRDLALPAIEELYAFTVYASRTLSRIDIPRLESLSALILEGVPELRDLGRLAMVPTSLRYLHLVRLPVESVVFPNLTEAEDMLLTSNVTLATISFPALRRVSTGNITYCPALPSCDIDAINARLVAGMIQWQDVGVCR